MKVGDLVKMDFETIDDLALGDCWGIGMIVEINVVQPANSCDDVHVLWSEIGLSWEMVAMLEKVEQKEEVNESR
jgi:hypothetical protein